MLLKELLYNIFDYWIPKEAVYNFNKTPELYIDHYLYYKQIQFPVDIFNDKSLRYEISDILHDPYPDVNSVHTRNDFLEFLNLTENDFNDRFIKELEPFDRNTRFDIPNWDKLIDGIFLEYPTREELIEFLDNVRYIELEIGGQMIDRVYIDIIKIQIKGNKVYLFENFFHQISSRLYYHEIRIMFYFTNRNVISPKIFATGVYYTSLKTNQTNTIFDRLMTTKLLRISIHQYQYTHFSVENTITCKFNIDFNLPIIGLFLILKTNDKIVNNKIKNVELFYTPSLSSKFDGEYLSKIPNILGMPKGKYYYISFTNTNPFVYNLDSYKNTINFSRFGPEIKIDFFEEFTGEVLVHAIHINLSVRTGEMMCMKYVN